MLWDIMGFPGTQCPKAGFGEESEGLSHNIYCALLVKNHNRLRFCSIRAGNAGQTACKPGSVLTPASRDDGWPFLWDVRCRTPRATDPGDDAETPLPVARRVTPIWSCSRWGLPCRFRCRSRGGLLPHRFTLAWLVYRPKAGQPGGLFSVALSLGSPPPDVIRHRVSVEPGLSSPPRLPATAQPSSRLTRGP